MVQVRGLYLTGKSKLDLPRQLFSTAEKPRAGIVHRAIPLESPPAGHEKRTYLAADPFFMVRVRGL
jgi:hypothetical protein